MFAFGLKPYDARIFSNSASGTRPRVAARSELIGLPGMKCGRKKFNVRAAQRVRRKNPTRRRRYLNPLSFRVGAINTAPRSGSSTGGGGRRVAAGRRGPRAVLNDDC